MKRFWYQLFPQKGNTHPDFPKQKKQGKAFLDRTKIQRAAITNKEVWLVCNTINLSWLNNIFHSSASPFCLCWGQISATGSILAQAFHWTVGIVTAKSLSVPHISQNFLSIWLKNLNSRFTLTKTTIYRATTNISSLESTSPFKSDIFKCWLNPISLCQSCTMKAGNNQDKEQQKHHGQVENLVLETA